MRKLLLFVSILLFSANITAQDWPESSSSRPSFSGFGLSIGSNSSDIFSSEGGSESFAGDYVTTPQTKAVNDDFGDDDDPGNPGEVPIIESILGILGLGGAYAWRLFSKNRKKEE